MRRCGRAEAAKEQNESQGQEMELKVSNGVPKSDSFRATRQGADIVTYHK